MDMRTGQIVSQRDFDRMPHGERAHFREITPTPRQNREKRVRRNDLCPCGSGKKFKWCCLRVPCLA